MCSHCRRPNDSRRCASYERGVELVREAWGELEERSCETGVEMRSAAAFDFSQSLIDPPGILVRPLLEESVIDVADGTDAADQRNLFTFEADRVAAAVPSLVVRPCDVLGHLHQGVV